jgi:hypothetical protein
MTVTQRKEFFSISSAKNKIIPETESESDDEAVHNGTHQETREEATSRSDMEEEGNENGSQVRAIVMRQRKKIPLVWNSSCTHDQAHFAMEGRRQKIFIFQTPQFLTSGDWWITP